MYVNPLDNPEAFDVVRLGKIITPGVCVVEGWARENEYDIKVGRGTAGATETLKGQPPAKGSITWFAWETEHFRAWNDLLPLLAFKPGAGKVATPAATPGSAAQGGQYTQGETKNPTGGTSSGTIAEPAIPSPGDTSGSSGAYAAPKQPPALSAADAIAIYYPTLADIGVSAVLPPEKLGQWEPDGDAAGGKWKRKIDFVEFMQAHGSNIATTPTGAGDGNAPGTTPAGSSEGKAPNGAANNTGTAGAAGQGAWGAA